MMDKPLILVDTHVHLQHARYADDLQDVLTRATRAGVIAAVIPGTNLADSQMAVHIAESYNNETCSLYAAVGVHPTEAHSLTDETLHALRELARHPRVVAIGEIGLDYYWPRIKNRGWPCADPSTQHTAFTQQLELASELGLPIIVHDREAHTDTLKLLAAWKARHPSGQGTLHAYAAGPAMLQDFVDLGFFFGLDGPVTFKKATALHEVARLVPLGRLLLETDGPYLTPVPHRGKRNEPAYLQYIASKVAELRGTSTTEIAQATTSNACRLFQFCN